MLIRNNEQLINSETCYCCNKKFDETMVRTLHHAIPKSLRPKKNIIITLCLECHRKTHESFQLTPKLKEFNNFIRSMEEFVTRHKKRLERIQEE